MYQPLRDKMPVRDLNIKIEKSPNFPDSRGQTILSAIINEHFVTGEPVGSKTIAEKFANASGLSSASIRGVMGELEDLGLLEQPHTSAGRVPTDKGYRFYVDNLLGVLSISNDDLYRIGDEFGLNPSDFAETPDRLMERTSQLLSALSNNVGIVVSPSLASDRLQHIEFVNLSDNRILGHHDATHQTVVVSKSLDSEDVPRYVIEYILYHEMLHIHHPTVHHNGRRYNHTPAFRADERKFEYFHEAERWIERNVRKLKKAAKQQ